MGILYDMQAFYRWLNDCRDEELLQRREALRELLPQLTQDEVVEEGYRLLRLIEGEMLARQIRP